MYKCDRCGTQVSSGIPANQVVVETRPRTYFPAQEVERSVKKKKPTNVPSHPTKGVEIVKEWTVCPSCYQELSNVM